MNVTVIGTGYVGLVTGAIFSNQGHDVVCVDVDEKKINDLKFGKLPIYEPGLDEVVATGIRHGCLRFTANPEEAVAHADVVFLAVGTPQSDSGAANLDYLDAAAQSVARTVKDDVVVVIKSTVPVGSNARIAEIIKTHRGRGVDVANNPEFLKEGTAIEDCLNPDRIVLGVRSARAAHVLQKLYQPLVDATERPCPVLVMDPESAEMTKYAANCLLAAKISFINEIANLCEHLGADVENVRDGICTDRRIGWEFLKPGAGYGGSCFPKDVRALISQAENVGFHPALLKVTDDVNERQKQVIPEKLWEHFDGDLCGKRIAVWGLAFKPGTDDIREAPALMLIERLLHAGASVAVHDPQAMENTWEVFGGQIEYYENKSDAIRHADALVVMTDWDEYVGIEPGALRWKMNKVVVFDGRNCLNREWFSFGACDYYCVGQAPVLRKQEWATVEESEERENSSDLPVTFEIESYREGARTAHLPCA